MFCPECRSEFRVGFTRCATCDVDLVEDLTDVSVRSAGGTASAGRASGSFVNFCGFFTLEEASDARATLRHEGIPAEILIRERPDEENGSRSPEDEYWLRVAPEDVARTTALLGFDEAE